MTTDQVLKTLNLWHNFFEIQYSLRKPIDFHLFKMSCLTCLVFSCVYWFFLNRWNYAKICMNKPYLCRNFFLTDWRHKRLKNTIDLLLFYGENFYGFSESEQWKCFFWIMVLLYKLECFYNETSIILIYCFSVRWLKTSLCFITWFKLLICGRKI